MSCDTGRCSSPTRAQSWDSAASSYPLVWPVGAVAARRRRVPSQAAVLALFAVGLLSLACFGLISLIGLVSGSLNYVHYSAQEIQQAGWSRLPLQVDVESFGVGRTGADEAESADESSLNGKLGRVTHQGTKAASDHNQVKTIWNIHNLSDGLSGSSASSSMTSSSTLRSSSDLHLLILTPLSTSSSDLSHYFAQLDTLLHPKCNTSLGFLVADEHDDTASVVQQMLLDRHDYREITLIKKDFGIEGPEGKARHLKWWQQHRRAIMAKARTTLLVSTLRASVDWVLWLDSDVAAYSPSLVEDLLVYGGTGVMPSTTTADNLNMVLPLDGQVADIVTPNIFIDRPNEYKAYDLNNWAETRKSRRIKDKLDPDKFIFEGGGVDLHRAHLTDAYRPSLPNTSPIASIYPHLRPENWSSNPLYDPSSPSFVGVRMDLDAVGGVATLVRADAHRMGAVFPAFLVDHQLETEGFGVLAKALGARIIGLPNYIVLHANH